METTNTQDLALEAMRSCKGELRRLHNKNGVVVTVVSIFRNIERGQLIDAKVRDRLGTETVVPATALFVV